MLKSIFAKKNVTCKMLWVMLSAILLLSLVFQYINLRRKHMIGKEKFNTETNAEPEPHDKLLFFFADWCGHCTDFKKKGLKDFIESDEVKIDIWHINENANKLDDDVKTKIAKEFNISPDNDSEITVAVKELMTKCDVKGFPTVYYMSATKSERFADSRTSEALTNFVNTMRSSQ
jgi:thioredoxin-related protein